MKVHSSVRMPSPRLSSFTRRMTRNRRKKVMEMREFSSAFWNPSATGGAVSTARGGVRTEGPLREIQTSVAVAEGRPGFAALDFPLGWEGSRPL